MHRSFLILFILIGSIVKSQNSFSGISISSRINDKIVSAILRGDAEELSNYFYHTIEVTLIDISGTFSKNHAKLLFKSFFSNHPPKSFEITNSGSVNETGNYYIGKYLSKNSKIFRTYYLIKTIEKNDYIIIIKFEEL